jgi:hypothetical protein
VGLPLRHELIHQSHKAPYRVLGPALQVPVQIGGSSFGRPFEAEGQNEATVLVHDIDDGGMVMLPVRASEQRQAA